MRSFKRLAGVIAGILALAGYAAPAIAQADYPTKPITVIVPFAAGGPSDTVARIFSDHMSRTLGQQMVIENVVGAGGTVGTIRSARAAPDGYTLILGHLGTHVSAVGLYPNLAYNPVTDFEPIGLTAGMPVAVLAKKDFPAKDLKEFVAYLKANETKINQAHAGIASVSHTTCLMFNSVIGIKPIAIPYPGTGPSMNALVGGQVDYMCDQVLNASPQVNAGTIKAYVVASAERNPAIPDVPTSKEGGLSAFQMSAWNGFFAPKNTPKPVVDKLNAALMKALDDPGVQKRLSDLGSELPTPPQRTAQFLGEHVKAELARWTPILKAAGAVVN
jgi:tripartite-type tricarboxylate transporter receptor subunit TctC